MTARRPDLLLLHGALGAGDQFAPLLPILSGHFELHTLDFEGHGKAPATDRPFRIDHFVENVRSYLDHRHLPHAHIFGYSMGGFVALRLALSDPTRVRNLATLGTLLRWDRQIAARELGRLDADAIAEKTPRFAVLLAERHVRSGWKTVVGKTRELLSSLGESGGIEPEAVRTLSQSVRIMAGDRDTSIDLVHSLAVARAIPKGEMEVLPDTPHPFERVRPDRLGRSLLDFFGGHDD